jgi:hypothetical protein
LACLAEEFQSAIAQRPGAPNRTTNLREAVAALAMLGAARASDASGGVPIALMVPAS